MAALSLALRIVSLALSVAAAVVMATACQPIYFLGPVVPSSALVYFVVASAISAVCAALAIYLSLNDADDSCLSAYDDGAREMAVSVLDSAAQALLFSAAGAVIALHSVVECRGPAAAFCGKVAIGAAIGVTAAVATALAALTRDTGSSSSGDGC